MDHIEQYSSLYLSYLRYCGINLEAHNFYSRIESIVKKTDLENPQSALELNNLAIITLIETEAETDPSIRKMGLNLAVEALEEGVEEGSHPLCKAHLALIYLLMGERKVSGQLAFSGLLETLEEMKNAEYFPLGLVYLPPGCGNLNLATIEALEQSFRAEDGFTQALQLFALVLYRSQLAFYTEVGLRFLQLATQILPDSAALWLQLGIAQLVNSQGEGLYYLQKAQKILPNYPPLTKALYLAYKDLQQPHLARLWQQKMPESGLDTAWLYVKFDGDILLALEPSFHSLVTSVLIAQGDWFEDEMEFWRSQIASGMTVIDVGANVGVYTFSAAQRVGKTGKVLAVEPFSGCVRALEQTCQLNGLDSVKVCAGAASDHAGSAYLSLQQASELNEIVSEEEAQPSGKVEKVACFTLDSLVEEHQLTRVDWLKINAEGHEIKVLQGSESLLNRFSPRILYENIAGAQGNNLPVAEFLYHRGYNLFRYRPYLQELIPLESSDDLEGNLNIIALPPETS